MRDVLAISRGEVREPDRVGDAIRLVLCGVVGAMLLAVFVYASGVKPGASDAEVPEAVILAP